MKNFKVDSGWLHKYLSLRATLSRLNCSSQGFRHFGFRVLSSWNTEKEVSKPLRYFEKAVLLGEFKRMEDEKVLDKEQWKLEVSAVIADIKSHVLTANISTLDGTDDFIYFNLTTLEGNDYCIQMSSSGFVIVDTSHDSASTQSNEYFETPYALLDKISPKYRESFARKLIDSLAELI